MWGLGGEEFEEPDEEREEEPEQREPRDIISVSPCVAPSQGQEHPSSPVSRAPEVPTTTLPTPSSPSCSGQMRFSRLMGGSNRHQTSLRANGGVIPFLHEGQRMPVSLLHRLPPAPLTIPTVQWKAGLALEQGHCGLLPDLRRGPTWALRTNRSHFPHCHEEDM